MKIMNEAILYTLDLFTALQFIPKETRAGMSGKCLELVTLKCIWKHFPK